MAFWPRSVLSVFSNDLAIDLGTATTIVFARGTGIVVNEPSIVAVNQKTGKVEAVGQAAKEMLAPSKKILLDRISKELGTLKHAVGEVVDAIGFIDSPDFSEVEKTLERGFASICPDREDKLMSGNVLVMGFESVSTSISSIIQYLEATRKSQEEGFESVYTELKEMRKSHKTLMRELIEVLRDGLPGPTLHA